MLDNIGFYTLANRRAKYVDPILSPLHRCELILTDRCNFKCPYCRGLRKDLKGDINYYVAKMILEKWFKNGLKNVRFSGGEPTLYNGLPELIILCKWAGVERIAISTNGSADIDYYKELIKRGVNDISISLDSCCSSGGKKMTGGIEGAWEKVIENIKALSKITYVTVGMVFTEDNIADCLNSIKFSASLGVSDIRIIPSAQYNKGLAPMNSVDVSEFVELPILQYRINNIKRNRHVRGIRPSDCKNCWLVMDDMAVAQGYHFPCIIHMREGGEPIGSMSDSMLQIRKDRAIWATNHNCFEDKICRENCLDVCVDYNNKVDYYMSQEGNLSVCTHYPS